MQELLLIHGAIGSAAQMEPLAAAFRQHFTVHNINLPGHGGQEGPAAFSMKDFVEHVNNYCTEKRLDEVVVFGYSMGGYIGMLLAKRNPQMVRRLVTLGTKFHWDAATAAKEGKMLNPSVIREKVPRFAQSLEQRHGAGWEAVLLKTAAMLEELGADPLLSDAAYASLQTPVLLMLGDRDQMVGMEETIAVYRQLPAGALAVLPGTPHPVEQLEIPVIAAPAMRFLLQ